MKEYMEFLEEFSLVSLTKLNNINGNEERNYTHAHSLIEGCNLKRNDVLLSVSTEVDSKGAVSEHDDWHTFFNKLGMKEKSNSVQILNVCVENYFKRL